MVLRLLVLHLMLFIRSDKYLTYQLLKEVPIIPTVKVFWDDIDKYAKKF